MNVYCTRVISKKVPLFQYSEQSCVQYESGHGVVFVVAVILDTVTTTSTGLGCPQKFIYICDHILRSGSV